MTHASCVDKLLNNVGTFEHGVLAQNVTHYPDSNTIEQMDALLNTTGLLVLEFSSLCIDTELTKLMQRIVLGWQNERVSVHMSE